MGKIWDYKIKVYLDKFENVEVYFKFYESVMFYGGKLFLCVLCLLFC